MPPDERDLALVHDMIEFCREVGDSTAGLTFDAYVNMREKRRSVERVVELIGEAASQLSESFRAAHPQISWGEIIGLRHVLIHGYGHVDQRRLWVIAATDVPELLRSLQTLLPSE